MKSPAATLLQGAWRRKLARRRLAEQAGRALQRVRDPASGKYYYYNVKTGATSWRRPAFLSREEAEAAIKTPRAFALRADMELRARSAVEGGEGGEGGGGEEWGDDDGSWAGEWWEGGGEAGGGEEADEGWRPPPVLPAGWDTMLDESTGKEYYVHARSGTTSWEFPAG